MQMESAKYKFGKIFEFLCAISGPVFKEYGICFNRFSFKSFGLGFKRL